MRSREAISLLVLACCVYFTAVGMATEADSENLAKNPGFEHPDDLEDPLPADWDFFTSHVTTIGVTKEIHRSGTQSLRVAAQNIEGSRSGFVQHIPVTAGKTYRFSLYALNSRQKPMGKNFCGMMGIEWINDEGREITRKESAPWGRELSRMRWTRLSVVATAPPDTTSAKFVVHSFEGGEASDGAFYVDDVLLTEED